MTDLTLSSSNVSYSEPMFGLYMIRITNAQTGDTLTLPVSNIISAVGSDETSAGVIKVARTTATKLTITCTNNDEVNIIVYALK